MNNFCFYIYAQKLQFIVKNVNDFFGPPPLSPNPLSYFHLQTVTFDPFIQKLLGMFHGSKYVFDIRLMTA